MISRRTLLCGCAALPLAHTSLAHAQNQPAFICSTIEPPVDSKLNIEPVDANTKITPFGTAIIGDRWRPADGNTPGTGVVTLGVRFLNGTRNMQAMVMQAATQWTTGEFGKFLQFQFNPPAGRAQIRVAFDIGQGNWSYVGRSNLRINPWQKTMNIANLVPHIIMHEFGHAIGLHHEHLHPGSGIQWNEPVVIADMAQQGWSPEQTRQNILNRLGNNAACIGDPGLNRASVMMYPIPRRWTLNGFESGENRAISPRDIRCLVGVYGV